MAFSDQQIRKLKSRLKAQHVHQREVEGQTLHYLEGWHVVAEANRIFGFDGWDRETISNSCVWTKQMGSRYCAAYVARVRITVRAGAERIIREGSGAGESHEPTPGQAHERASKAAETDATKRAFTTFGNCFGLTLYGAAVRHDHRGRIPLPARVNGHGLEKQSLSGNAGNTGHIAEPFDARHKGNGDDQNGGARIANGEMGSEEWLGDVTANLHPDQDAAALQAQTQAPEQTSSPLEPRSLPGTTSPDGPLPPGPESGKLIQEQPERASIDKSMLAIAEPKRVRDPGHLKYVADQPCMICGRQPCEAHHLRYVQPRALGRKSSDAYTVPLCALHHRELHARGNERAWWSAKGRDPLPIADQLWRQSSGMALRQPKPDGVFG